MIEPLTANMKTDENRSSRGAPRVIGICGAMVFMKVRRNMPTQKPTKRPSGVPKPRRTWALSPRGALSYSSRLIRSEEHTSELQSQFHLVCRLLLEKKKK